MIHSDNIEPRCRAVSMLLGNSTDVTFNTISRVLLLITEQRDCVALAYPVFKSRSRQIYDCFGVSHNLRNECRNGISFPNSRNVPVRLLLVSVFSKGGGCTLNWSQATEIPSLSLFTYFGWGKWQSVISQACVIILKNSLNLCPTERRVEGWDAMKSLHWRSVNSKGAGRPRLTHHHRGWWNVMDEMCGEILEWNLW